jgi:acyl dehydratase
VDKRSVLANSEVAKNGLDDRSSLFFEDFRAGQRFTSGTRTVTAADVAQFTALTGDAAPVHVDPEYARSVGFAGPIVHGPFGIGVLFGLLDDAGLLHTTAIAMLDLDWRFHAPIVAGDTLRFEMTVTRCRASRSRPAGVINRHFRLVNQDGLVVQEGTSAALVRARGGTPDTAANVRTDFCAPAWGEAMAERLSASPTFKDATSAFDGSIGLACGRETVQLRIYRGSVLETARSTPAGPTFTVSGTELAWVGLAFADRNDFIARATLGEFAVSGSAFDYLRMTKAIVAIWDAVRDLAADAASP